jgi:Secretion system C-terminal sorting domain/Glycosyl hydrolase family 14
MMTKCSRQIFFIPIFLGILLLNSFQDFGQVNKNSGQRYIAVAYVSPLDGDKVAELQQAKNLGCNAVNFALDWSAIYGDHPVANAWIKYDAIMQKAHDLGMKIGIRIMIDGSCTNAEVDDPSNNACSGFIANERMTGYLQDGTSKIYQVFNGTQRVMSSLAAQSTKNRISSFTAEVINRYKSAYAADILWVNLAYTPDQEAGFPFTTSKGSNVLLGTLYDYSPPMIIGFQAWLQTKYCTVATLNSKWNKQYANWSQALPKIPAGNFKDVFQGNDGKDWWSYRTQVLKEISTLFASTVRTNAPTMNVISDYGAVFDKLALRRGNFNFKYIDSDMDGIKCNNGRDYDHRFSTDLLRSNLPNKMIIAEVEYDASEDTLAFNQFDEAFNHGAKWVNIFQLDRLITAGKSADFTAKATTYTVTSPNVPTINPTQLTTFTLSSMLDSDGCSTDRNGVLSADCQAYQNWRNTYTNAPINIRLIDDISENNSTCSEKVLILGNSMTNNAQISGWGGNWGMAASDTTKDFTWLVRNYYTGLNPFNIVKGYNIASFEQGYANYNFDTEVTKAIRDANDWTTIILRLGENLDNVTNYNSTDFKNKLAALVTYMKKGRSNVKVIVTNRFWTDTNKDADLQSFANTNSYPFVNLTGLYTAMGPNTAWVWPGGIIPDVLIGASPDIKKHPNDAGMKGIADRIICVIKGCGGCTTPLPPTNVSASPISGGSSTLSATCATGTVVWLNGSTVVTSPVSPTVTTTYYAKCSSSSTCESTTVPVTVIVTVCSPPTPPTNVSATPISGGSSTLSATCATGTVVWLNGSTVVTSPVSPTVTTTYSAKCSLSSTCGSTTVPVTVTVLTDNCIVNKVKLIFRGGNMNKCCYERLQGAMIQGANSINGPWKNLYTFTVSGTGAWQEFNFANTATFTFVRFQASPNGYGELTELEFYNNNSKLTGSTIIGTGNFSAALDNNETTSWEGWPTLGTSNYAGIQLSNCVVTNNCAVKKVKLIFRGGSLNNGCCRERLIGAKIQGLNSSEGVWKDIYTFGISGTGSWQEFTFNNTTTYDFIRFQASPNGYGELTELEFYNNISSSKLTGSIIGTGNCSAALDNNETTSWEGWPTLGTANYAGLQLNPCQGVSTRIANMSKSEFQDVEGLGILIFPNPTSDRFKVNIETIEKGEVQMDLLNINGVSMKSWKIDTEKDGYQIEVDMTKQQVGLYLLKIVVPSGKTAVKKVIRQE